MTGEPLDEISPAIERVFRDVYGQAVASLVRVLGDITNAEDAVQDAFVVAARQWPIDGIPANPHGWIVTTARRRAIDRFRRVRRGQELEREAAEHAHHRGQQANSPVQDQPVTDERLRLIFTCCHPSLRTEHQVALTLRLLGGLSVEEVARGFLVSEAAMAKRLTRAKYKIAAANIPYRVPAAPELADRLASVLAVVYLIYNAGTDALDEPTSLRSEAIRLARALAALLPDEPEPAGLLALLLLNESRVPSRRLNGSVVLLRDQDRSRWHRPSIDEGLDIVRACLRLDRPGPFQVQAAIQAVHASAASFAATDWGQILALYDHLTTLMPTPVVALNRAIVVMETNGPAAALELLDALAPVLDGYGPLHAARATALRRIGEDDSAGVAYRRAAELVSSEADSRHLLAQIGEMASGR